MAQVMVRLRLFCLFTKFPLHHNSLYIEMIIVVLLIICYPILSRGGFQMFSKLHNAAIVVAASTKRSRITDVILEEEYI
jgi:hypothetical protein